MSMISCNTDIIDSELLYHSFKTMISYMIFYMILSMKSYVYDIMYYRYHRFRVRIMISYFQKHDIIDDFVYDIVYEIICL